MYLTYSQATEKPKIKRKLRSTDKPGTTWAAKLIMTVMDCNSKNKVNIYEFILI